MPSDGLKLLYKLENAWISQQNVKNIREELHTFDALLVRSTTKVTKESINTMESLKIVGRAGVGIDNIDIKEANKRGVIVVNSPNWKYYIDC